jgi:uncharacterized protein YndB with AHSA1/START domain
MVSNLFTRRDFPVRLASFFSGLGVVGTAFGSTSGPRMEWSVGSEEISRSGEAIHQEVVFKASRKRVYDALTDTKQFDKIIQLSGVMQSMPPGGKPTEISREAGGAFALFGGYITGRHIELVPNERIVQAWRAGNWDPGVYSIAKFVLVEQGSGTKIVFDHTGFPKGAGEHLAAGWKAHYWEPLEKFLAYCTARLKPCPDKKQIPPDETRDTFPSVLELHSIRIVEFKCGREAVDEVNGNGTNTRG